MMPEGTEAAFERIAGLVERVTFHNQQNGFCVLRLKVRGERELVTLIGHTPAVTSGEYASASGQWVADREHGRQFKARFVTISPPTTLTGIERYLGSGMVKGIGPVYAGKFVKAFGAAVFDVIEQSPERLREIPGIGEVRARKIASGCHHAAFLRSGSAMTDCISSLMPADFMSTRIPLGLTVTRSTRNWTIRACSAGKSSPHTGSID
jgi:ATP-dependent exoDNAse (exonuclease V) alpha subunit